MVDTLLVASAGRSGSTLLTMLLGSNASATPLGEITQLPRDLAENNTCSCGQHVRACSFWRPAVGALSSRLRFDVWDDPYALDLGFICSPRKQYAGPVTPQYEREWRVRHGMIYLLERMNLSKLASMEPTFATSVSNTLALFDAVREVTGRSHVVDSSKTYLRALAIYKRNPQRTRILLLTRDGRASFYSRLRDGYDRRLSLLAWRNYYQRMLPLLEQHVAPEHVCHVKYEDLAADPARELQRICERTGLDYDAGMLDIQRRTHHVTSGNDMRLAPRAVRPDRAWHIELRREDRRYFERHAGELNRTLGYS